MLVTPPSIVPQQSIRGIAPGMSRAVVSAKLGTPNVRLTGHDDFGPWTAYTWQGLKVTFRAGRVTQLESFTRRDRTARGVGVGSTRGAVRRGVPGIVCEPIHCHLGVYRAGRMVTDFFIRGGKVWRVVVGRVID